MKELFWIIVGMVIGTVFHDDIPVLNNISATKIKTIINNASEAVMEEPPPPPYVPKVIKCSLFSFLLNEI